MRIPIGLSMLNLTTKKNSMEATKKNGLDWLKETITYDNGFGQRWCILRECTDFGEYFEKAKKMNKNSMIEFAYLVLQKADEQKQGYVDVEEFYNEIYK